MGKNTGITGKIIIWSFGFVLCVAIIMTLSNGATLDEFTKFLFAIFIFAFTALIVYILPNYSHKDSAIGRLRNWSKLTSREKRFFVVGQVSYLLAFQALFILQIFYDNQPSALLLFSLLMMIRLISNMLFLINDRSFASLDINERTYYIGSIITGMGCFASLNIAINNGFYAFWIYGAALMISSLVLANKFQKSIKPH